MLGSSRAHLFLLTLRAHYSAVGTRKEHTGKERALLPISSRRKRAHLPAETCVWSQWKVVTLRSRGIDAQKAYEQIMHQVHRG